MFCKHTMQDILFYKHILLAKYIWHSKSPISTELHRISAYIYSIGTCHVPFLCKKRKVQPLNTSLHMKQRQKRSARQPYHLTKEDLRTIKCCLYLAIMLLPCSPTGIIALVTFTILSFLVQDVV